MGLLLPLLGGVIVWQWKHRGQVAHTETGPVDPETLDRYSRLIRQVRPGMSGGQIRPGRKYSHGVSEAIADWEWHFLQRICNWGAQRTLTGFGGPIRQVAFGRNGLLAVAAESPGVRVCDAFSGKALTTLGQQHGPVNAVAFSPDYKRLATVGNDGYLRVYDFPSGNEIAGRDQGGPLHCVAFSTDDKLLAAGGGSPNNGILWLWDARPGPQPLRKFVGNKDRVVSVTFNRKWPTLPTSMVANSEMATWGPWQDKPFGTWSNTERYRRLIYIPNTPTVGLLSEGGMLSFWLPPDGQHPARLMPGYGDPPKRADKKFDDQPEQRRGKRGHGCRIQRG